MTYLLDSHVFLWSLLDRDRLTSRQMAILLDQTCVKYISSISFWELSLKYGLGKLDLKGHTPEELFAACLESGFMLDAPQTTSLVSFYRLPAVTGHKDPFDRLLIWQAIQSGHTFVSSDSQLADYKLHGLKLA